MATATLPSVAAATENTNFPPGVKPLVVSELIPALNPHVITDAAGLDPMVRFLERTNLFGMDTETSITNRFFHRRCRTIQVGDKNEQYIIDLMAFAGGKAQLIAAQGQYRSKRFHTEESRAVYAPVVAALKPFFESRTHLKVGHNLQFDYEVLKWCLGMRPWNFYDTYLAEKNIYAGLVDFMESGFWGLEDLVARYFKTGIEKGVQKQDWLKEEPLNETDIAYCALDCRLALSLKDHQYRVLVKDNLLRAAQIDNDAIPAFGDQHLNGFFNNPDRWRELIALNQADLEAGIRDLDELFMPLVGEKPVAVPMEEVQRLEVIWRDLGNNKSEEEQVLAGQIKATKDAEAKAALKLQLKTAEDKRKVARDEARKLYQAAASTHTKKFIEGTDKMEGRAAVNYNAGATLRKLMLKVSKWRFDTRNLPNTNDKTLEKHAEKPVVKAIRKYRKYKKLLSTYGDKWIRPSTHPDGGYVDADTGRLHPGIDLYGAATGRTAARDPNTQNLPKDDRFRACFEARPGYKMATIDAAGQELCILADYSGEQMWIDAFNRGWDVHSICAEIFDNTEWVAAACKGGEEYYDEKDKKTVILPPCAYYLKKKKCKCPLHQALRDVMKAINFGVPYGLTAFKLAADLEISVDEAEALLAKHKALFPGLWRYLEKSGKRALEKLEARTKSGRRRRFTKVEWDQAKAKALKDFEKKMNQEWFAEKMKKLCRTTPIQDDVMRAFKSMQAGIEREGKNTPIQGTGADQVKLALGCGYDSNGKPFAWHRLEPDFGALFENMVHDEVVFEAPDEPGLDDVSPFFVGTITDERVEFDGHSVSKNMKDAFDFMSDCMTRAGAEFVKLVPMLTEGHIDKRWRK